MPASMIADALAGLAEALQKAGIRWYLFGAQAAVLYGIPRLTADVDATAEFPLERVEELAALLAGGGFVVRVSNLAVFAGKTRVIPLTHERSGVPVDLVLAGAGLEEEFLGRARMMRVGNVSVPVIAPDDLIVTKVLAGRPKDLEDVLGVLAEQGPCLDLTRIRRLLGSLDEALSRNDLVATFDTALQGAQASGDW